MPISSSPSAAAPSPTAPRPCRCASPTTSARADEIDRLRPVKAADGSIGPPDMKAPTVRQISVPTTLSGGEFSAIAGVTDERTKTKELLRHPRIMASAVILDPAVTVHTPEWLWLSTGIRAVDHCVEGVCSNEANAYADAQALKGLALLSGGLPRVKADPTDLDGAARLPDGHMAVDGAAGERRADGRQPRHRLRARRRVRRAARAHVVHHAAGRHALEQDGQRRASGPGVGGHGPRPARTRAMCSTRSSAGSACRAASVP